MRLEREPLQKVRLAALLRDARLGSVDLPAGEHLNLRRRGVEMRHSVGNVAVSELHECAVAVGQRDSGPVLSAHVGKVVQSQPFEPGHSRRVVPSVGEQFGPNYRTDLFMTDVGIFEVEGEIPRVGAVEVLVDVIPNIDPP